MTTKITRGGLKPGMYVIQGGKRWQVHSLAADGPATRVRARRPWTAPMERTSWLVFDGPRPGWDEVTLDADQGTCADCGLALAPGLDEEAAEFRDATGRYFCRRSGDALHHPVMLAPQGGE